jgi:uncharacterized damage-inducible protein DinB
MQNLFRYNWQVRDEWFAICRKLPQEELLKERVGGLGSILKTLFHIVDVEYSWIVVLRGEPVEDPDFIDYRTLERVEGLSLQYRGEVEAIIDSWTAAQDGIEITVPWRKDEIYTHGEVLRHVIAHEIHHVGQLSVWSRELGIQPVSANFIGRGVR